MNDPKATVEATTQYEITATSDTSFESAINSAIRSLDEKAKNAVRFVDVTGHRLNFADGDRTNYEVTLQVSLVMGDKPFMW